MSYPVTVSVEPRLAGRNRLTTAFRFILAIPHLILVGGPAFQFSVFNTDHSSGLAGGSGLLGAAACLLAIVSWFTILISGNHIPAIRQFTEFYMRWHVRAIVYFMLLEDTYPPFGDGAYPTVFSVAEQTEPRDRMSVALRLLLVIPHAVALCFVLLAWWIVTVIAWFAILVTGEYPSALVSFSIGALRWYVRVEAYLLLLVDEYPPFSMD